MLKPQQLLEENGFTALREIMAETVATIQRGRSQIFGIAEMAREESTRLRQELEEIKALAAEAVEAVDKLERASRQARYRLMVVSRDFQNHSETEIREAYEQAQEIQVELSVRREQERALRQRRDDTEARLRRIEALQRQADALVSNVGVALELLEGNIHAFSDHWEELEARTMIGARVILAQEEERQRVARELHDGPAQALANIGLRADLCEKIATSGQGDLIQELRGLTAAARQTLEELRRIMFRLRPMALDDLGLVPTLRRYVEQVHEETGLEVDFGLLGTERSLPASHEIAIFRLVQESLTNVIKHAHAHRAQVRMEMRPGIVTVVVADDGCGFDVDAAWKKAGEQGQGLGLPSMQERMRLLGGDLVITSRPGKGTRIQAKVPIPGGSKGGGARRKPEVGE